MKRPRSIPSGFRTSAASPTPPTTGAKTSPDSRLITDASRPATSTFNQEERPMACTLSVCPIVGAEYQGKIGDTFTVDAQCSKGAAVLVAGAYANQSLASAPFTFTIASGVQNLALIIEADTVGSVVEVVEVCSGGGSQDLDDYMVTDPNHDALAFRIKGV